MQINKYSANQILNFTETHHTQHKWLRHQPCFKFKFGILKNIVTPKTLNDIYVRYITTTINDNIIEFHFLPIADIYNYRTKVICREGTDEHGRLIEYGRWDVNQVKSFTLKEEELIILHTADVEIPCLNLKQLIEI